MSSEGERRRLWFELIKAKTLAEGNTQDPEWHRAWNAWYDACKAAGLQISGDGHRTNTLSNGEKYHIDEPL